jgi:hypothetical protein
VPTFTPTPTPTITPTPTVINVGGNTFSLSAVGLPSTIDLGLAPYNWQYYANCIIGVSAQRTNISNTFALSVVQYSGGSIVNTPYIGVLNLQSNLAGFKFYCGGTD